MKLFPCWARETADADEERWKKALNWTKNTQMATYRIVLALNLYLRVRDEGFDTKCGKNIGEKLIPRLGEN